MTQAPLRLQSSETNTTFANFKAAIERALSLGAGKNVGLHVVNIFDLNADLFKDQSAAVADALPRLTAQIIELDDAAAALMVIEKAVSKMGSNPDVQEQLATLGLNLTPKLRDQLPDGDVIQKLASLSNALPSRADVREDIADVMVGTVLDVYQDGHVKPAMDHIRKVFMSVDEGTRTKLLAVAAGILPSLRELDLNAAFNCAGWLQDRPEGSEAARKRGLEIFKECDAEYHKNQTFVAGYH